MEIRINIPMNDYVQPTEVREKVVQMICDSILKTYLDRHDLVFEWKEPKATLCVHGYKTAFLSPTSNNVYKEENISVRSCEMSAAFDILQEAGYFIYPAINTYGETIYHFSTKPSYAGRCGKKTSFDLFID